MPGRSVLQWDKDDCAAIGLVKFDLFGPRGCSRRCTGWSTWCGRFSRSASTWGQLPQEPEVYDLLCRADTVGVFQVESRAQMGTLAPGPTTPRSMTWPLKWRSSDPGQSRATPVQSLHPTASRRGGGHLSPPLARAHLAPHTRCPVVPRAAHGDGGRHRRVSARPRPMNCARPWRPSAGPRRMDASGCRLYDGMARRGVVQGKVADAGLRRAGRLCEFRIPRVALGVVRPSCLFE